MVKSTLAITLKSRNAMLVGGPCAQRAAAAFAVFRLILYSGPSFVFCPKAKHDFAPASLFSLSTREPFASSCDRKFFCEQSSSVDGLWYWPRLASSADHLGHRAASARTSSVRNVGNVAAGDSICSHSRSSFLSPELLLERPGTPAKLHAPLFVLAAVVLCVHVLAVVLLLLLLLCYCLSLHQVSHG